MNLFHVPWLEIALLGALTGAILISLVRVPIHAHQLGMLATGLIFVATVLAWLAFYMGTPPDELARYSLQNWLFGRRLFMLDQLNAPLVPAVALLHFLICLATARTKMRTFSSSWSLAAETLALATFGCNTPWLLVGLLTLSVIPPYIELRNRERPTRVYVLHMTLFVVLLWVGWTAVDLFSSPGATAPWWAIVPLMAAILVRCGTVPAHCWVTDWFEHASFGIALLFVVPLSGVYAAVRLVMPVSPHWVLSGIGTLSLVTAFYASAMALIQLETRRFFAMLFLSHASLVLVGLELETELSLTGSLCLWFSVILSLGGFGLTLRAVESRFGRVSLANYTGLYEHSPSLAGCFLLTGLASVGFPGTLGFISTELLVDSAVEANPFIGIIVIATAALNGIAVVRAYFLLFTGARHVSTVSLVIGRRERVAVLTFSALVLGGGLFPQPGVATRQKAAEEMLRENRRHLDAAAPAENSAARAGSSYAVPNPKDPPGRNDTRSLQAPTGRVSGRTPARLTPTNS